MNPQNELTPEENAEMWAALRDWSQYKDAEYFSQPEGIVGFRTLESGVDFSQKHPTYITFASEKIENE